MPGKKGNSVPIMSLVATWTLLIGRYRHTQPFGLRHLLFNKKITFFRVLYCDRLQMMSQRVKNKKVRHETKSSGVTVVLYTLWRLLWSIYIYIPLHTVHTHGKMYLFHTIKNSKVYRRNLGAWKKKSKFADVIWRGFDILTPSDTNKNAYRSHVIV